MMARKSVALHKCGANQGRQAGTLTAIVNTMHIELIDSNTFRSVRTDLIGLLRDAVEQGASLGFLSDLDAAEAAAFWDGVAAAVAQGNRVLLVARDAVGAVMGTVQLDLCTKKNGINRAEVQKLMVHSKAQRGGIARALMTAAEEQARQRERGLVYLDTEAGSGAEGFYRACGYAFLGGLPEFACSPDGQWRANAIYYKTLFLRNPL
jgi:acetyltransferase